MEEHAAMEVVTNTWRKSSFSSGGASNCVEIERSLTRIRDSKNPAVAIPADVASLVAAVRVLRP